MSDRMEITVRVYEDGTDGTYSDVLVNEMEIDGYQSILGDFGINFDILGESQPIHAMRPNGSKTAQCGAIVTNPDRMTVYGTDTTCRKCRATWTMATRATISRYRREAGKPVHV